MEDEIALLSYLVIRSKLGWHVVNASYFGVHDWMIDACRTSLLYCLDQRTSIVIRVLQSVYHDTSHDISHRSWSHQKVVQFPKFCLKVAGRLGARWIILLEYFCLMIVFVPSILRWYRDYEKKKEFDMKKYWEHKTTIRSLFYLYVTLVTFAHFPRDARRSHFFLFLPKSCI